MSGRQLLTPENLRIAASVVRELASEVFAEFLETSQIYQGLHINPSPMLHSLATALSQRADEAQGVSKQPAKKKEAMP